MSDDAQLPRLRWARSQRFTPSARGSGALALWNQQLTEVRSAGRAAFDQARTSWATDNRVQPDDVAVLSELSEPLRLEDVAKAVADAGVSREAVKQALERLYEAGLVDTINH
jgi:ubiquinone biosynthesis protein Coq4